jgi:DNA-binding CsgD family transcriptional regulator
MSALEGETAKASLTPKQLEVLELLERRLTIAEIAYDLGVSDSAINQRIKLLKLRFAVNSHRELVELYRASHQDAFRNSTARNPQLPPTREYVEPSDRDDQGSVFRFNDSSPVRQDPPWSKRPEPTVVPGVLDGRNAGRLRLAVIVSMLLGALAAVILAVAAANAVTGVL